MSLNLVETDGERRSGRNNDERKEIRNESGRRRKRGEDKDESRTKLETGRRGVQMGRKEAQGLGHPWARLSKPGGQQCLTSTARYHSTRHSLCAHDCLYSPLPFFFFLFSRPPGLILWFASSTTTTSRSEVSLFLASIAFSLPSSLSKKMNSPHIKEGETGGAPRTCSRPAKPQNGRPSFFSLCFCLSSTFIRPFTSRHTQGSD